MPELNTDRKELPPLRREYVSPNGRWRLVVEALEGWRRMAAQATLQHLPAGGSAETAWSQAILQQLGPREALVSDDGRVLMMDEGINVRSRYTLMLFDTRGTLLATHDFDSVMRTAQVSNAEISAHARRGTWMGAPATLAPGGTVAQVPFGGRVVAVSMADGRLSLLR